MNKEFTQILSEYEITSSEDLTFHSNSQKDNFLEKLKILQKNNISLYILNNDLKDIILNIELNPDNLKLFKSINWKNCVSIIKNYKLDSYSKDIYNRFLELLRIELEIVNNNLSEIKDNFDINSNIFEKCKKYNIDILSDYIQEGKKNTVNDFILYFNKRLKHFTNLIYDKIASEKLVRISNIKELSQNAKVAIIGLVSSIQQTKQNHIIITVEDKSSSIKCFINKSKLDPDSSGFDKSIMEKISKICLDDGIGIEGKVGDNIIWVDNIILPSLDEEHKCNTISSNEFFISLSDLHIGSTNFDEKSFLKLLKYLEGKTTNEKLNKISQNIKYVIICTRLIEGIDILENKKEELLFLDTKLQYLWASLLLSKVPKDKCIIYIPSKSDVVRMAEPQLKLSYKNAYMLYNLDNFTCFSNPCEIKLFTNQNEGIKCLLYSGSSFDYFANEVNYLRDKKAIENPSIIASFLLEKKHLAQSHHSTIYIPDPYEDLLAIKNIPDYFICAHMYKLDVTNYKGCNIICNGSFYRNKTSGDNTSKCVLIDPNTSTIKVLNLSNQTEYKNR